MQHLHCNPWSGPLIPGERTVLGQVVREVADSSGDFRKGRGLALQHEMVARDLAILCIGAAVKGEQATALGHSHGVLCSLNNKYGLRALVPARLVRATHYFAELMAQPNGWRMPAWQAGRLQACPYKPLEGAALPLIGRNQHQPVHLLGG